MNLHGESVGTVSQEAPMSMEFKDYYQVLGVPKNASADEIKQAFRKLARKYHPDVAKDKKSAENKFKEINEAYEVLGDPKNRAKYDQLGAQWQRGTEFRPPPGWQRAGGRRAARGSGTGDGFEFRFEGTGLSDFFERFFGGETRRRHGFSSFDAESPWGSEDEGAWEGGGPGQRGQDVQGDIVITLAEGLHGGTREIQVQRTDARTGQVETQRYQVRIPAGIREGQSIRLRGQGDGRTAGGGAGDLYLRLRYAQDPDFRARGSDLVTTLVLAPWEAVLGGTMRLRTLDGTLSLKVPPRTQQGQQLRVRGKGLPTGSDTRGDLYVAIAIQVPTEVTAEERRLWRELANASSFRPRRSS